MGSLSRPRSGGKRPRPVAHVAFEGAIRIIETPRAPGWQRTESSREGDGFTGLVLKYVLPAPPAPLVLLAKIYTFGEDRTPPEDPATTDWRAVFRPLLSDVSALRVLATRQLTLTKALPAWEVVLDGPGADSRVPLRIRERRAVADRELFIVTAMGSPPLFRAHAADIDRWFDSATFVPLGDVPARR